MAAGAPQSESLASHDNHAIAEVYGNFFDRIFAYCNYRLFRNDLAEDATAAVFLRLVEKWPSLKDKSQAQLLSWLYGTASNVAAKYLKDTRRSKDILDECSCVGQSACTKDQGRQAASDWVVLYCALRKLPVKCQELIALRYFQGLDAVVIAAILKVKPGAVRVRLSRALCRLKKELNKKG